MNPELKQAINMALQGHNMLLLGAAGTRKSFVVNEIYKQLSEKGRKVKITCSTGIACHVYGIKACTVHQFLGIGDGRSESDDIVSVIRNNRKYEYVVDNICSTDTLIVGE